MINSCAISNVVTRSRAPSIVSQLTATALPDVISVPHVLVEHRPVPGGN